MGLLFLLDILIFHLILCLIFLLMQFPILHSFLLTTNGRKILRLFSPKNFGKTLETTNYATIASIQLLLLFLLWSPSNIIFYDLKYPNNILNSLLFTISWILLSISSFQAGYQVQTGSLGWTSLFFLRKTNISAYAYKRVIQINKTPYLFFFLFSIMDTPNYDFRFIFSSTYLYFLLLSCP